MDANDTEMLKTVCQITHYTWHIYVLIVIDSIIISIPTVLYCTHSFDCSMAAICGVLINPAAFVSNTCSVISH